MALPLLERPDLVRFRTMDAPSRIPSRKPKPGEQYRFHFDMTRCIGCKCCEVACNEQNNNPPDIRWRRVGEIEGGEYPFTRRLHLSMGCNHCLDAACLKGCPVDAYTKDALTGIVLHSASICIGCQYCTWNCPYGVPQFNPERGVVGKCDLCHGRLEQGREPACVNACPQGAIEVEIVNIAAWAKVAAIEGNAPGMPAAESTRSTTRITLPLSVEPEMRKGDYHRVRPEHPHWPLVFLLVLTQMSAAAALFGAILPAIVAAHVGLTFSLLHLGRPVHAWRALKMWRRSWLSREVLAFSIYAGLITPSILFPWLAPVAGLAGIAGIYCSARIYMVPARPSWNSWHTPIEFLLTGFFLGSLAADQRLWAAGFAAAQAVLQAGRIWQMNRSMEFEARGSARLLLQDFRRIVWVRFALLLIAPALPLAVAVAAGLLSEIAGRYLFFVSVVPRNMAATFFGTAREAA
jgi:DMSO reductase iron-sulfur subunit